MLLSSKVHYDYTQANNKVNNSQIMINLSGKTFPERSKNIGTDRTLWLPSDNVLQTLSVSWVDVRWVGICGLLQFLGE